MSTKFKNIKDMEKIKISFKDEPQYIIHPHSGTVVCIMNYAIEPNTEIGWTVRGLMHMFDIHIPIKCVGVAKLHPGDTWDEKTGMRVAKAKAETQAYLKVSRAISKAMDKIMIEVNPVVDDFIKKSIDVIEHNEKFINGI